MLSRVEGRHTREGSPVYGSTRTRQGRGAIQEPSWLSRRGLDITEALVRIHAYSQQDSAFWPQISPKWEMAVGRGPLQAETVMLVAARNCRARRRHWVCEEFIAVFLTWGSLIDDLCSPARSTSFPIHYCSLLLRGYFDERTRTFFSAFQRTLLVFPAPSSAKDMGCSRVLRLARNVGRDHIFLDMQSFAWVD